jgi:MFS family permease
MLLLPITMSVVGAAVFVATAALMTAHFSHVPNGEYLVQLLITLPAIWIALFSPVAGWLADRFGRRRSRTCGFTSCRWLACWASA